MKYCLYIYLILLNPIFGCTSNRTESNLKTSSKKKSLNALPVTFSSLKDCLGLTIKEAKQFLSTAYQNRLIFKVDTLEFEDQSWEAVYIFYKDQRICTMECSIENNTINRITIDSDKVDYKYGKVNMSLEKLQDKIDTNSLNLFEDGEIGFISLRDRQVVFFMDTVGISNKFYYGVNSFSDLPKNTRVDNIVIFSEKIN